MKRKIAIVTLTIFICALQFGCGQSPAFDESDAIPARNGESQNVPTEEVPNQSQFKAGSVTVISGGKEYEPYVHFVAGYNGEIFADGADLPLEEVAETLPVIQYADDFQIIIDGVYAEKVSYSLYDDELELILESSPARGIEIPPETGMYMLRVGVYWSNGETSYELMRYSQSSYFFMISVC